MRGYIPGGMVPETLAGIGGGIVACMDESYALHAMQNKPCILLEKMKRNFLKPIDKSKLVWYNSIRSRECKPYTRTRGEGINE